MFPVPPPEPYFPPAPVEEYSLVAYKQLEPLNVWTPDTGRDLAIKKADKYGVSRETFLRVMECESSGFIDPAIQSGHFKNGVQETSFGYAQFNLPSGLKTVDGRTIDYEIATDPEQALDAAAYNFSIGNKYHWACK